MLKLRTFSFKNNALILQRVSNNNIFLFFFNAYFCDLLSFPKAYNIPGVSAVVIKIFTFFAQIIIHRSYGVK